jgi:hypothetical protein
MLVQRVEAGALPASNYALYTYANTTLKTKPTTPG